MNFPERSMYTNPYEDFVNKFNKAISKIQKSGVPLTQELLEKFFANQPLNFLLRVANDYDLIIKSNGLPYIGIDITPEGVTFRSLNDASVMTFKKQMETTESGDTPKISLPFINLKAEIITAMLVDSMHGTFTLELEPSKYKKSEQA